MYVGIFFFLLSYWSLLTLQDDKFLMVQNLTNLALGGMFDLSPLDSFSDSVAQLNLFEALGLTKEQLEKLKEMGRDRSVTIRLQTSTTCHFHHEVERIVESPKVVTEVSGTGMHRLNCSSAHSQGC